MKKNLLKLFLLAAVLIVGAGEMWGGYYKIRVVCVNHLGEPITNHKVFICERNEWVDNYASCYNSSSSCIANKLTSDSTSGVYSSVVESTGNAWYHLFVRTEDRSVFQGWFWDSSLTQGLFTAKYNYKRTDYMTNAATTYIPQAASAEDTQVTTIYAKFDDRVSQTYYAKLHVAEAAHRGAFRDKWGGTQNHIYMSRILQEVARRKKKV